MGSVSNGRKMNQNMSVRKSISESGSWLIYALQRTEPKRVAAVVVGLVVGNHIVMRRLPELERDPLVLEEPRERLAVLGPDDVRAMNQNYSRRNG